MNLLTERPRPGFSLMASSGVGNYGSLEQHLRASYVAGRVAEQFTGSRDTSDGFIADRNYSSNAAAVESWLKLRPGMTDVLVAVSDRPYGANLFYGPYDSWERTKEWFASIQQQIGERTAASFGYRRHSDMFVLFADRPEIYENNHITTSYEGALRRVDALGRKATVSYGVEADGNEIRSSSLGEHGRNQGAGYANLGLHELGRFSLSVGAREEVFSGGGSVFSPNVAGAFMLTRTLRLRGSDGAWVSVAYVCGSVLFGPQHDWESGLQPESSWSYESGVDWSPGGGRVTVTTTGFYLRQRDSIDYSKQELATPALTFAEPWQAVNVQNLNIAGVESTMRVRLGDRQRLQFSYSAAHAASPPAGLISEYAYNYAAQNAIFGWSGELPGRWGREVSAMTQVDVVQRTTQTAYPVWDVGVERNAGRVRPYLRLLNLSNTGYQEIPQVPMQGRTVMAGAAFLWDRR